MAEATGILLLNAEDNDESHLTITEEGSNSFSITTGAALHGTYGYQFDFDGTNNLCYADESFSAGSDIYARSYFKFGSDFSMNAAQFFVMALRNSSGGDLCRPVFLMSSGVLSIYRFYYYLNSGLTFQSVSQGITIGSEYYIETRFKSGNGDGIVALYLNGVEVVNLTGLTNNNYQADTIRIGNYAAAVPTTDAPLIIDDIKIASSAIGAYSESSGSSNSYYYQQQQM